MLIYVVAFLIWHLHYNMALRPWNIDIWYLVGLVWALQISQIWNVPIIPQVSLYDMSKAIFLGRTLVRHQVKPWNKIICYNENVVIKFCLGYHIIVVQWCGLINYIGIVSNIHIYYFKVSFSFLGHDMPKMWKLVAKIMASDIVPSNGMNEDRLNEIKSHFIISHAKKLSPDQIRKLYFLAWKRSIKLFPDNLIQYKC